MDGEQSDPPPVEQKVPGPGDPFGGHGHTPYQQAPPYAAPFPITSTPNEMMGRIILGFVFVLFGWIVSSINVVSWNSDVSEAVLMLGIILKAIGVVIIAIAMLQGALQQNWYSDTIRLGILISVGLIVIGL